VQGQHLGHQGDELVVAGSFGWGKNQTPEGANARAAGRSAGVVF
jgi:hypothetical protein